MCTPYISTQVPRYCIILHPLGYLHSIFSFYCRKKKREKDSDERSIISALSSLGTYTCARSIIGRKKTEARREQRRGGWKRGGFFFFWIA